MNARLNAAKSRAGGIMSGFTTGQKAVVGVATIALVMAAFVLSRWAAQPDWAPLYGGLSGEDANAITEQLTTDGVKYQLSNGGTTILVPQESVYGERIKLSAAGLPANEGGGTEGYSLLDKQGITTTDFQQNVAYQRALEGELAKTLQAMDPVKTAVVRLAIPQRDVFTSDDDKPTASVVIGLRAGQELTTDQVRSVSRIVAGSVPMLDAADVTVTDSTGKLLTGDGVSGGTDGGTEADEATAAYEARLSKKAQTLLDQTLGAGHSAVQIAAALNMDSSNTTSKTYVADDKVKPTSITTKDESYDNGAAGGVNGTLGQVFAGDETLDGGGTGTNTVSGSSSSGSGSYSNKSSTVNNSVGQVITQTVGTPGSVKRLTVAVALDSKTAATADPAVIQQLVANAVGLDTTRGDTVDVKKIAFDTTAAAAAAKELDAAASAEKMAGYLDIGKKAGLGLLIVLALFVAMRATRRKEETTFETTAIDLPGGGAPELLGGTVALPGTAAALTAGASTGGPNAQLGINQLVEDSPEDVAAMLQGWLGEGRR